MKTVIRVLALIVGVLAPSLAFAQDILGIWQGTLNAGKPLRIQLRISVEAGALKAVLYSLDQGGQPIPANTITVDGTAVRIAVTSIGGTFEGKLSTDGQTIAGTFLQGTPLPLTLTRVTPDTAWTAPAPPTPMAA